MPKSFTVFKMGSLFRRYERGKYYAKFVDGSGKRVRRCTGTSNKSDAQRILAKWEADANLARHGVGNAESETLTALVDAYIAYLGNSGDGHKELTEQRLRRILALHDWTSPRQIDQYAVETSVRQMLSLRTGNRLSLRSQHHYLTAAKSFTRWLHRIRKALPTDPLAGLRKPRFDADRRHTRRFLLADEWHWLSQTQHALLYATAIQTGLRSRELLAVQPSHLHDGYILLPAKHTKNGKQAKQYIAADLADQLRGNLPFEVPNRGRMAAMFRRDLHAAKLLHLDCGPSPRGFLEPVDPNGHVLDFHALRHTCGAWLAIAGVSPKVIQSVMRHSSIALTLDTYGHLLPGAEEDAIGNFAQIMGTNLGPH